MVEWEEINWKSGKHTFFKENELAHYDPHDHQFEAWDALRDHFNYNKAGIIHVPTGGGKTFIAGKWVWEEILFGAEVMWITNFTSLLSQAAFELIKIYNSNLVESTSKHQARTFNFIWGETEVSWGSIDNIKHPDIIFSTHASAIKRKNEILKYYGHSKKLIVVYDECHHAKGNKTIKFIRDLKELRTVFMLGITATPKCSNFHNTKKLWELFDAAKKEGNKLILQPIYSVGVEALENNKILAHAEFANPSSQITEKDIRIACNLGEDTPLVNEKKELLPCVKDFLANNKDRLAKTYETFKNNLKFRKTIIFTINIAECENLFSLFNDRLTYDNLNIRVGCAHSKRKDAQKVLKQFQDGELDVLINVNMATTGYNAPKTNTVIITRPINTDYLVLQMIGRGLRGIKAGGNPISYLVSIVDNWDKDIGIINLEHLYKRQEEIEVLVESTLTEIAEYFKRYYTHIHPHPMMHKYWYLPQAYLEINNQIIEDEIDVTQEYLLISKHLYNGLSEYRKSNTILSPNIVLEKFFGDCPEPRLSTQNIESINSLLKEEMYDSAFFKIEQIDLDAMSPVKPRNPRVYNSFFTPDEKEYQKFLSNWDIKYYEDAKNVVKYLSNDLIGIIKSSHSRKEDFSTFLKDLYSNGGFPLDTDICIFDSRYCPDKRLGFSRISYDGRITLAINRLMDREIIPKIIIEFLFFHHLRRASYPYDPLGLHFCQPYHHLFTPSDSARLNIENPIIKGIYQEFIDAYCIVSGTSDDSNVAFCKGFLMGYGSIIEKDNVYLWY